MEPTRHKVEGTRDLEILDWPSGAVEFRRSSDDRFQCFVVSHSERSEFMKKLKEVDNAASS